MCALVYSLSVEFKINDFNVNVLAFQIFLSRMFEKTRECTLTKGNLACSVVQYSFTD